MGRDLLNKFIQDGIVSAKDIFKPRVQYRPFEYPEVLKFVDALNQTFWVHSEVDFTGDIQDYHVNLKEHEKQAIKRAFVAIAQIEVNVKKFWGNLYNHLPKPEINGMGSTFAESEFRHSEAYSRLLQVLNLEDAFQEALQSPVLLERMRFLDTRQHFQSIEDSRLSFALNLIIFSILIENVSLFSQFAIVLYFTHHKGFMKNSSNIIAWTSKDEQVHANAGMYLFNEIVKENPQLIDDKGRNLIVSIVKDSIDQEQNILDWIFEKGELEGLTKAHLLNFMKDRINESLLQVNLSKIFEVDAELLRETHWFSEEIYSNTLDDFFAKRPVEYTKHNQTISANDLF